VKIEAAQIPPLVCLAACATALSNAWAGEGRGGARSAAAARMIRYRQPTIPFSREDAARSHLSSLPLAFDGYNVGITEDFFESCRYTVV